MNPDSQRGDSADGRAAALRRGLLSLQIGVLRARPVRWLGIVVITVGIGGLVLLNLLGGEDGKAALQLRQAQTRTRAELYAPLPVAAADPQAQRLTDFRAQLGEPGAVESQLARIFALVRQSELVLAQADYQWLVDDAAATERVVVQLPLKGSYRALRSFLEQLLAELPFASIDDLGMRRDAIGDDTLSATVRISLHLHSGVASNLAAQRQVGPAEPQWARTRP